MSTPYQLSLLRRTFAAMAMVAIAFTTPDTLAAGNTVKLNGGNKNDECTFSSMSITPDGGVTVQCSGTTNPPPPVPAGCPAVPQNMLTAGLTGMGNPLFQMQASGQIVSIPLPSVSGGSGQLGFGESAGGAYTPQPVTLEVSINKCPGVIDTNYTNRCNIRNTNGNYNSITWLTRSYSGRGGTIDASTADASGLCWAGDSGTYYINARWAYASCAFGAQVCGFSIQYNLGGY